MQVIGVTGKGTSIVSDVCRKTGAVAHRVSEVEVTRVNHYVFAAGLLHGLVVSSQTIDMIAECLFVNTAQHLRSCEDVLTANDYARVCVIGSQSAVNGSYDLTYTAAKAGLHAYVAHRKVLPTQSLVCISPPIISDAGMTIRRPDYPAVLKSRHTVTTSQVSDLIISALTMEHYLGKNMIVEVS